MTLLTSQRAAILTLFQQGKTCQPSRLAFLPIVMLPNAAPKSIHQISPRVILHSLPHRAHRRLCTFELLFTRNLCIHSVYFLNFVFINSLLIFRSALLYQKILHFLKNSFQRGNIKFFQLCVKISISKIRHSKPHRFNYITFPLKRNIYHSASCSDRNFQHKQSLLSKSYCQSELSQHQDYSKIS